MNNAFYFVITLATSITVIKLYKYLNDSIIIKKSKWKEVEEKIRENEREKVLDYVKKNI